MSLIPKLRYLRYVHIIHLSIITGSFNTLSTFVSGGYGLIPYLILVFTCGVSNPRRDIIHADQFGSSRAPYRHITHGIIIRVHQSPTNMLSKFLLIRVIHIIDIRNIYTAHFYHFIRPTILIIDKI